MDLNRFINGTQVLAMFPLRASDDKVCDVVVVLDRGHQEVDRYVWAEMNSIDATYWRQGHYFREAADAMAGGMAAAGWLGAVRASTVGREHVDSY